MSGRIKMTDLVGGFGWIHRGRETLVARLLRHAAGSAEPLALDPADAPARAFRWLIDGGLGPLLWHAARATSTPISAERHAELRGADLTARFHHANLVDTACDVIDAGAATGVPVILLKGISVSEELYPAEHLRPMGDIDVLIPRGGYARLEAELLSANYERLPYPEIAGHHHGAPLRHRTRGTLVELHVELFPDDSPLRRPGGALSAEAVTEDGTQPSRYHGRPVLRLSPARQLLYIAASWFNDLTLRPPHPSFLASLFDAVYLTTLHHELLADEVALSPVDNPIARGSLLALLTYLPRFGLQAPSARRMRALRTGPAAVGPFELRLIHAMLDRYQIGGRRWNFALPPPVPGRYNVRNQLHTKLRFPASGQM